MSQDLLDKIRKLLAKAEGTDNVNEAEAFSAKAAQLIAEHRVDPQHVREALAHGALGLRRIALGRGAYVRARLALLDAVARNQDCEVVFETGPAGTTAVIAGYESDLDVTEVLYTSLHAQAAGQMNGVRSRTPAATQRWRRSFLFGFANRVAEQLEAARTNAAADGRRRRRGRRSHSPMCSPVRDGSASSRRARSVRWSPPGRPPRHSGRVGGMAIGPPPTPTSAAPESPVGWR